MGDQQKSKKYLFYDSFHRTGQMHGNVLDPGVKHNQLRGLISDKILS